MDDRCEFGSYWAEQRIDPRNYCPHRGAFPHEQCDVELYEAGAIWSALHGVCHAHKKAWGLQSGGAAWDELPTLGELAGKGYYELAIDASGP
jgi:hypothetical protein